MLLTMHVDWTEDPNINFTTMFWALIILLIPPKPHFPHKRISYVNSGHARDKCNILSIFLLRVRILRHLHIIIDTLLTFFQNIIYMFIKVKFTINCIPNNFISSVLWRLTFDMWMLFWTCCSLSLPSIICEVLFMYNDNLLLWSHFWTSSNSSLFSKPAPDTYAIVSSV